MRHLKAHRKLGRTTEHRISLLRNLATSLINSREERIITTLPKAKELRPFVERAITLSLQVQASRAQAFRFSRRFSLKLVKLARHRAQQLVHALFRHRRDGVKFTPIHLHASA